MKSVADVEFKDHSVQVKNALKSLAIKALEEAAGEIESQTKRNTPVGKINGSGLKNSWQHRIESKGDEHIAIIGSPLERALWVEFGTGEYAIPESGKGGRKGGWYIPVGNGKGQISEAVAKAYGMTIRNGKGGKKWVFTRGMKPKRPLHKAYTSLKNRLIRRIQSKLKGGLS